jgi:hypothetical protein
LLGNTKGSGQNLAVTLEESQRPLDLEKPAISAPPSNTFDISVNLRTSLPEDRFADDTIPTSSLPLSNATDPERPSQPVPASLSSMLRIAPSPQ